MMSLVEQMFDDNFEAFEVWNPDVVEVLSHQPIAVPFTAPMIAAMHPNLPTETTDGAISIWDTLCGFVENGDRLFRQVDEPFGVEWVRVGCCYEHYDPSWPGTVEPPSEDSLEGWPVCQQLWLQVNRRLTAAAASADQ